ncbi:MAG: hypothetical protein K2X60_06470 [Xanthobacteraceae bacterium]|nr:hypothetical protein [Xanthobacteraceae bacterium]
MYASGMRWSLKGLLGAKSGRSAMIASQAGGHINPMFEAFGEKYHFAGETLRCPGHGFEFSLIDGRPAVPGTSPLPMRLRLWSNPELSTHRIVNALM